MSAPTQDEQIINPFPLYKMILEGNEYWLSLRDAGIAYDSGWIPVQFGGYVLDGPGKPRAITKVEEQQISNIAEEYSGSK